MSGNEAMNMCERAEKLAKREVKPRSECGKCCCCAPHTKHNSQKTFKECLEAFNDLEDLNDDAEQDLELLKMIAGLYTIAGEPMRPRPVRQPACPGRQPASVHGRPPHPLSSLFEPPESMFRRPPPESVFLGMGRPPAESAFRRPPPQSSFLGMGRPPPESVLLGMRRPPGSGYPGLF